MTRPPPSSTLFPYTTLFRSHARLLLEHLPSRDDVLESLAGALRPGGWLLVEDFDWATAALVDPPSRAYTAVADRKSTRLNSSHMSISYAVFCLKKKKKDLAD